jgi:predicted Fe-Mo cluster-binding NifX family protein
VAGAFYCVDIENKHVLATEHYTIPSQGREKVAYLHAMRVDIVICSAISKYFARLLYSQGIELLPGIIGDVEDICQSYIDRSLTVDKYAMPGCRGISSDMRKGRHCYKNCYFQPLSMRRENYMKTIIAVSARGNSLESNVDPRFGRATGFVIYNNETNTSEYVENIQNVQAVQGAGIQAAKQVIDCHVEVVITGNIGPKGYRTLHEAGVEIYCGATGSVKDALAAYRDGSLQEAENANVEGHW